MKTFIAGLSLTSLLACTFAAAPGMEARVARERGRMPDKREEKEAEEKLRKQYRAELDLMLVKDDKLPEGCRLAPMEKRSKFLPSNPTVSQDPPIMMLISMGVGTIAVADQSITNDLESVFSAVYHDTDGKETGVNLLLFKEAEKAGEIFRKLKPKAYLPLFHHDRYLLGIWTDNQNMELANWMKDYFEHAAWP